MADGDSGICSRCKGRGVIGIHNDSATVDGGRFCSCNVGLQKFARVVEIICRAETVHAVSGNDAAPDAPSDDGRGASVARRLYPFRA